MGQSPRERLLHIAHADELDLGRRQNVREFRSVLPGAQIDVGQKVRIVRGGPESDLIGVLKGFGRVGRYGVTGLVQTFGSATSYELVLCMGDSAGVPTLHAMHEAHIMLIDEREGAYFVTARKGGSTVALLGPFEKHAHALVLVGAARRYCCTEMSGRDWVDVSFGTVRVAPGDSSALIEGRFNSEILSEREREWIALPQTSMPERCTG